MRKTAFSCLLVLLLAGNGYAESSKVLDEVFPAFTKGMEQIANNKDANKRTLAERITFRDSKFQRIIKECFEIMANSPVTDLLDAQDDMDARIRKNKEKILGLAQKSITAPDKSWNPFENTQQSIKKDIAKLNRENADLKAEYKAKQDEVYRKIRANGINISKEQFEQMLTSASAIDMAKIMAVAENTKEILKSIADKASQPESPKELIQTYAGVYMMCYRVYAYAISFAMEQIDDSYLPKLAELRNENKKLRDNANSLARQSNTEQDREIIKSNIATQERMLEVIGIYSDCLKFQKKQLEQLCKPIEARYKVAENTYHTIRISSELLDLIHKSESDFSRVFNFQPPEFSILYEDRLKKEFEEVTAKLKIK